MKKYFAIILCIFPPLASLAQVTGARQTPDTSFIKFFAGHWSGSGKFANGKAIAADMTIRPTLDSAWLEIDHTDRPPNRYKARSFWGTDLTTGEFVAYTFDNFHGHRQFTSNGWKNNKLILATQEFYSGRGIVYQHFIYEKTGPDSFTMTYETSVDAINWVLGDSLLFRRIGVDFSR